MTMRTELKDLSHYGKIANIYTQRNAQCRPKQNPCQLRFIQFLSKVIHSDLGMPKIALKSVCQ